MKLTQSEVAGLYSQGNAHGASPLGLVVALYDTILRDLTRASDAIAQSDVEKRTFELNHALRVIAELENVLDFERGGDAAPRLKNFYTVTRGMILDASVKNSRESLRQLWEIFATVRKAWNEAEQKMKAGGESIQAAMGEPNARAHGSGHSGAMMSSRRGTVESPHGELEPVESSAAHRNADASPRGNWSA